MKADHIELYKLCLCDVFNILTDRQGRNHRIHKFCENRKLQQVLKSKIARSTELG